jgi:hypothetical protein
MILGFSTQLNGKPTMFTNKIVKCMWQHYPVQMKELALSRELPEHYVFEDLTVFEAQKLKPKLHTIREDKNDRWHAGIKIDFFINCRQKNMFRFAPVLPVVSIQNILITYTKTNKAMVFIDDKCFYMQDFSLEGNYKMQHLAQNDGFDTIGDFFDYFNKDFAGKIIHWTDLKY